MTASHQHKHPSQFSDDELRRLLRAERLAVTQRIAIVKRELRAMAAELDRLQRRLDDIDASEEFLDGGS
jgi:septal ring factor EnvC (AmiA/AmiB activator)